MLCMSKALHVWSIEQETRKSPRSWNAHAQTAWLWSVRVCLHLSLDTSQIFTVASPEVVATSEPRGWKATPLTQSLCPSPLSTSWPSGMDHIFHVWSSQAVAMTGIFGWNVMREMAPMWPLNVLCFFISATLAGSKLEFAYGFVRSSLGHGACLKRFDVSSCRFVASPPASCSSFESSCTCESCFCSVSAFDRKRSRSSRISIFSFMATSYLCRSSVSVGSYCS
mmetsp:Transcript_39088/g.110462  ORF Transcript_39088/g.110462 Transcript_39088/m.110462 type:complete len:224 (-) Transcript_39088:554-1225(-)